MRNRRRWGQWAAAQAALVSVLTVISVATAAAQATIKPGMTEAEVRTALGEPLTVRKLGNMAYMYYRNDCLKRCGTYDVVFLEGGQVIDAILRDSHRKYDGVSSSPAERRPEATKARKG